MVHHRRTLHIGSPLVQLSISIVRRLTFEITTRSTSTNLDFPINAK